MASSSSQEEDLDLGSGLSSARVASVASVRSASDVASKGTSLPLGVTTPSTALFTSDEFPPLPASPEEGITYAKGSSVEASRDFGLPPLFSAVIATPSSLLYICCEK